MHALSRRTESAPLRAPDAAMLRAEWVGVSLVPRTAECVSCRVALVRGGEGEHAKRLAGLLDGARYQARCVWVARPMRPPPRPAFAPRSLRPWPAPTLVAPAPCPAVTVAPAKRSGEVRPPGALPVAKRPKRPEQRPEVADAERWEKVLTGWVDVACFGEPIELDLQVRSSLFGKPAATLEKRLGSIGLYVEWCRAESLSALPWTSRRPTITSAFWLCRAPPQLGAVVGGGAGILQGFLRPLRDRRGLE